MQKDLLDELIEKPQRETAGADTSARFDYQRNWAFCEMLRRHLASADYLVAFEFHDDTVFLSPGAAPTNAEFFQVKTSKSTVARKLADLTSRPKKSNSILGKMFLNFAGICSSHVVQVVLVSNVAFELPRSLLAQYFAFLQTMAKFNPSIACPMVLDSPLQQEQDKDNIGAIFKFIFSHVLPGQQLILGTLTLDGVDENIIPPHVKRIHLTDELHLLQKTQYADLMDRLGKMHEETLAAE